MYSYEAVNILVVFLWWMCDEVSLHAGHVHDEADSWELGGDPLLLVSFDGFRWDYLKRLKSLASAANETNHFEEVIRSGVWAEKGMMNVFSTVTFPNHYSIVTGLYQENHGVVGNSVFLPGENKTFHLDRINQHEAQLIYKGEPIWVTFAGQQNPNSIGCFMWVGCDKSILGHHLQTVVPYRRNPTCTQHLGYTIRWLRGGMKLVLLYFSEPDHTGHRFGPESEEVGRKLLQLNRCLGRLLALLKRNRLYNRTNLLVVSDHGMVEFWKKLTIEQKPELFIVRVEHYSHLLVQPLPGRIKETLSYFRQFKRFVKVYRKSEIPMNWHYKNSPRITDILVVAELGVALSTSVGVSDNKTVAGHGYDNQKPEMHPIFLARGPAFAENTMAPSEIHSVDIYLLMCKLLGLQPAPNNGSHLVVGKLLKRSAATSFGTATSSILIAVSCSTGAVAFVLIFFFLHRVSHERGRQYRNVKKIRMIGENGYTYKPIADKAKFLAPDTDDSSDEEVFLAR